MISKLFASFTICLILVIGNTRDESPQKTLKTIPAELVIDKNRGDLLGQNSGVLNWLAHEMSYINKPGNVQNYTPVLPDGAVTNYYTDFEWVYIFEMQENSNAVRIVSRRRFLFI